MEAAVKTALSIRVLASISALSISLFLAQVPLLAQDACRFAGAADGSGLTLVGNAALVGNVLRVAPSVGNQDGAAWCSAKSAVAGGFETAFAFQITGLVNTGADGLTFVIQNSAPDALGTYGYGIGYDGMPNSLAVEFDTWQNYWDPDANHISVNTGGTGPNSSDHSFSRGVTSAIPNLSDGAIHMAKIAYTPGSLRVYLDSFFTPVLTVAVDLSTVLSLDSGKAWVGFTSSTGGAWENHDILLWDFSNSGTCSILCGAAVPDSAGYATAVPFAALAAPLYCSQGFSCDWDFGDGTPHSASPSPSHYYAATGSYTWTLRVTGNGLSCSKSGALQVTPTMQGACAQVPPFLPMGQTATGVQAQGADHNFSCDDGAYPGEAIRLGGWPDEGRAWFHFAAGSPGEALAVTFDWMDDGAAADWKELDVYDWQTGSWTTAHAWNDRDFAEHVTTLPVCLEPSNIGFLGMVRLGFWASADSNLHLRSVKVSATDASALSLASLVPTRGGNGGPVSVHLDGSGFQNGASVLLRRSGTADIFAAISGVDPCGLGLSAQFDLTGAPTGIYDLVVANPASAPSTLPGAFTVETSRPADLWVDVVGRNVLRGGRSQTYYITYGNNGNQDALVVPLWIEFPKWIAFELGTPLQPPNQDPAYPPVDFSQIPVFCQTDTDTVIPLVLFRIQPGVTGTLPIRLTASDDPQYAHVPFTITATLNPPMLEASDLGARREDGTSTAALACEFSIAGEALNILGVIFPPADCAASIGAFALNNYVTLLGMAATGQGANAGSYEQLAAGVVSTLADCGTDFIPGAGQVANAVGVALGAKDVIDNCAGPFADAARALFGGSTVVSGDPNDKAGPTGYGDARYFRAAEPLRYAIFFENRPDASAPAQVVTITDPLDASVMDLSTFALGSITIGTRVITPPPGLASWSSDVDLRPSMNLILRIQAGLNISSATASWTFTSLDPATMQLTEDPLAGFLPPDVHSPEGQGSVLFSLDPKAGLAQGTPIANKASIVFDLNAPMDTPTWSNSVDAIPPHSSVLPLPAITTSTSFTVRWSGTDDGAGISDYTITVSEDGGPAAPWLIGTAATSGTFTGVFGHTYAFASQAYDGAGNAEAAHAAPDASTRLQAPMLPGDCDGDGQVSIGEVQKAINMFLGTLPPGCGVDCNGDGSISIGEVQKVINGFLGMASSC